MSEFDTSSPPPPDIHPRRSPFSRLLGLFGGQVGRGALGMLGLRVVQIVMDFLNAVLLARLLGTTEFGAYAFAMSWVGLIGIPAGLGFDRLVIREIAKYRSDENWSLMRGIVVRSTQLTISVSIILAICAGIVIHYGLDSIDIRILETLKISFIIVPLFALARLRQAMLWGLGHPVMAQAPDALIQPAIILLALVSVGLIPSVDRTGPMAIALVGIAAGIACISGITLVRRVMPHSVWHSGAVYQTATWLRTALPFVWILGMNVIVIYTDIVVIGWLLGPVSVGVYKAASQVANLVAFPLTAVSLTLAPTIAALFAKGDNRSLQLHATRAARTILAMSMPIFLALLLFGDWTLLGFGQEFVVGWPILTVLSFGYLVNAAMGTSGYLLIMTKHERLAAIFFTVSAVLNLALNLVLVPIVGAIGAAIATATSVMIVSVAFAICVYQKLGIQPTAISVHPGASEVPVEPHAIKDHLK